MALIAPAGIADTLPAAGFAAAPAAGAVIATTAAQVAGVYRADVVTYQSATVDALSKNMELRCGARVIGSLLATAVPSPARVLHLTVAAGETVSVNATAIGTGQYNASIQLTRVG